MSRANPLLTKYMSKEEQEMKHDRKRGNGELDFEVYHFIFETSIEIFEEVFEVSKHIPREKFYLTDLARRHSKQVCTNLAEAWRLKENKPVFLSKLSDAAQAASKTQTCLELASKHNFINRDIFRRIDSKYEDIFDLICASTKSQYAA
jgi:four helix bundle protein